MLQPNEQKDVKVTINIPKTAQPGGYFGLVRFAPATAGGEQSVTLSASVGSLILAEVPGNIKENLAIASFDVRKDSQPKTLFTSGKNLQAVVRFQNSGDIQEQPFGKILIRKGGATVASYEINTTLPRGDVLPDSIRRFSISLDKLGSFGKYTMEGNFGYGSHGQLLTATRTFYIIPISLVIIVILAIFLILFAVFIAPNLVKKYNRRIVQKAIGKKRRS